MTRKINRLDIREVSLKMRSEIDSMSRSDPRLLVFLEFFHKTFLKLVKKIQLPVNTDVLNAVIGDCIEDDDRFPDRSEINMTTGGYSLGEIFNYFNNFLSSTSDLIQLMYMYGFSQGILNRIMRKLRIEYEIPPPFPV